MRYRRARSRVGAGLAIGLSLLLTAAMPPAVGAGSREKDVIVRVVDERGSPVPGARVTISALPMAGPDGPRSHAQRRVATADRRGRARLTLSLTADERMSAELNGGWINLEVMVLDPRGLPTGFATFSHDARPSLEAQASVAATAHVIRAVARQAVAQAAARAVGRSSEQQVRRAGGGTQAVGCVNYHWEVYRYESSFTKVGELNSASDTPVARFTYGRVADSEIDTAFRAGTGVWTIDGRVHIGNTQSLAAGINGQSNYHWGMKTKFDFALLFLFADCPGQSHKYMSQQRLEPIGWKGGAVINSIIVDQPPRTKPAYSEWFPRGGEWHRQDAEFASWSGAASLYGASLGAQSGASQFVRLDYEFGQARARHWLYGSDAHISTSSRVFASDS